LGNDRVPSNNRRVEFVHHSGLIVQLGSFLNNGIDTIVSYVWQFVSFAVTRLNHSQEILSYVIEFDVVRRWRQ
jgi:hypothetical protein